MAFCQKCGNKYFGKECLNCKEEKWNRELNKNMSNVFRNNNTKKKYENIKNENKIIKISIVIIAICITLTTTYYFMQEYQKKQELNKITKLLYGTDDYEEIKKINKKLEEQNEKIMKQFRKIYLPK
ncbi:hypothetical protein [Sulfurimonas sp.]